MNTANEADRLRLQELANQHLADNRLPFPESVTERDAMIDAGVIRGVEDDEIIGLISDCLDLSLLEAVERLASIDFAAARERYQVAA